MIDALGRGEQIIILRKGGIHEGRGGFQVDQPEFWLFPTLFHQQGDSVTAGAAERFREIADEFPPEDTLRLEYFATVADWRKLENEEAALRRDTPFGKLAKGERRYPPHVLTQLINLRAAIETERSEDVREALLLTMSPLLTKFASRKGRPAPNVNRRAIRDHFLRRAELTTQSWADYAEAVPSELPDPDLEMADAREQPWPSHRADVILTSPPYPGVYDYVGEQEHRLRWVGSRSDWSSTARKREIGARGVSPASSHAAERAAWDAPSAG